MSKQKKTMKGDAPARMPPPEPMSSRGKALAWAGGAAVALGLVVVSFADPLGRNWAASLSPFLILGGYAAIGFGLFDAPQPPPAAPEKTT